MHRHFGREGHAGCVRTFIRDRGLDRPIYVQFGIYMADVLQGDFGTSIRFSRPVSLILVERLPMTIELSLAALTLAVIVGIPLGMLSAMKHNTTTDVVTMVGANIGVSMPVFWLGLMLAYFFALVLKDTPFWLPPSGRLTAGHQFDAVLRSLRLGGRPGDRRRSSC